MGAELRDRVEEGGEKVCPLLVGACIASGSKPETAALCWRAKCAWWAPADLKCGVRLLPPAKG